MSLDTVPKFHIVEKRWLKSKGLQLLDGIIGVGAHTVTGMYKPMVSCSRIMGGFHRALACGIAVVMFDDETKASASPELAYESRSSGAEPFLLPGTFLCHHSGRCGFSSESDG